MPAWLVTQGYRTVLAGFQHITEGGTQASARVGYQHNLSTAHPSAAENADAYDRSVVASAAGFLADAGSANSDKTHHPFFLDVGFFTTHRTPTQPAREQWHNNQDSPAGDPRYVCPPSCLPDTPSTREDYADYLVAAGRLDGYIGSVLDALDQAGLREQTLVVITTDHGIAFPLMKGCLTGHGTGVMLLTAGPGFGSDGGGGHVVDGLVSHVDLFPTLCDAMGCQVPAWIQGQSFYRVFAGGEAPRDAVFAEMNYHAAYDPMRSVRNDTLSYIRRLEPVPYPVLPNIDDSASKTKLYDMGVLAGGNPAEELYDLKRDPTESANRVDDSDYAVALAEMRGRLESWMRDTDDPACHGRVHVPGMLSNPRNAYSPSVTSEVTERE